MEIRVDEPRVIEFIGYNQICANARFVFEKPFLLNPNDQLKLVDGLFFLIKNGEIKSLAGRWDR